MNYATLTFGLFLAAVFALHGARRGPAARRALLVLASGLTSSESNH